MAVLVIDIVAGGPAERSGLQKGDIILSAEGEPIGGVDDLHRLPTGNRAGTDLSLELLRAGRILNLTVVPIADD